MTSLFRRYSTPVIFLAGVATLVIAGWMITRIPVSADSPTCHAVVVLDRSGSVDDTDYPGDPSDMTQMKAQIMRLVDPGGLNNARYFLAFWSFSSQILNAATNYDAPYYPYINSIGLSDPNYFNFKSSLDSVKSGGGTDYEQGFGFDSIFTNSQKINTHVGPGSFTSIDNIIKQSNIIIFMTDGVPNTPGQGEGNARAKDAAWQAVQKLKRGTPETGGPKGIWAGMIGGTNPAGMNYVLSDTKNQNDSSHTFPISDYAKMFDIIKAQISQHCNEILPPPTVNPYSLTPTVTSNNTIVSGNDSASFSYNVNNSAKDGYSEDTAWSVKRVLVDRGQPVDPLHFGGAPYRDDYSCPKLVALVNNKASCTEVATGQPRSFSPGNTSLDNEAVGATNVTLDDNWAVGTKVCYVLTVSKPTNQNNPVERYSAASCLTIGKRPLVQIHGGDLRVGRHFITDSSLPVGQTPPEPAKVVTSLTPKMDGNTYGSWGEYAVFSPGLVVGFASLSGLEGGYQSTLPNTQEFWSKLTFANTDNDYGLFTTDDNGQGTIPNVRDALLTGRTVARDLAGVDAINLNGPDVQNGLYQKDSGNLNLDASVLQKNKTVIVYVPEGTLTITGNIDYVNGPYTDIGEIPQLILIAKNIAIKESVAHVSAWLIADDEKNGTVSTCDNPATLTVQICNQQLLIDGPVMARHLNLRRTGGAGAGGASGDPAEVINLPADAYLWSQSTGGSDVRAQTSFTTELPPYF